MSKVKCSTCKQYHEKSEMYLLGISSFCSVECFNKKKWSQTKPAAPLKSKPIQSKPLKRATMDESLRDEVMAADGYRCRFCGGSNNLITHHVVYRSTPGGPGDEKSNLITLCNEPCHLSIIHKNKHRYQSLCLGVIWLREIWGNKRITIPELEHTLSDSDG